MNNNDKIQYYPLVTEEKKLKFDKDKWIVPYTNLITIFMILFMVLFVFAFTGSKLQYEKMLLTIEGALGKEQKTDLELLELTETLSSYVSSRGLQELVKLQILPDRVKIVLLTPIIFDVGEAELKPSPIMEELRNMLKEIPNRVVIEGHTCNLPVGPKCKYRSNLELSGARAFSLLKFMTEGGIAPERLTAMGIGENMPLVENDTEEHRKLNRRVEISIMR
jgi:chemotaxis protein MotB